MVKLQTLKVMWDDIKRFEKGGEKSLRYKLKIKVSLVRPFLDALASLGLMIVTH